VKNVQYTKIQLHPCFHLLIHRVITVNHVEVVQKCINGNQRRKRPSNTSLHRVPKKTKQICFCQNFVKFPQISIIFSRKMGNDPNICEVHSLSTSPNLRHHLTVLNANVPSCYITPNVVICNKLLTI